ncbi:hypothetical protein [Nocardia niigatensis]
MVNGTHPTPCRLDPRFIQLGEDDDWHLHPATIEAVAICETECPISRVVGCARAALGAGQLATEPDITLPADGVIAAGIVCRGDNTTSLALREVISRYGTGAALVPTCPGCERRLIPAGQPLGVNEARPGARGMCTGCMSAASRSGQLARVYQLRPTHCIDCARPLVPRTGPLPEGHARHHSLGRCTTCQTRYRRGAKAA